MQGTMLAIEDDLAVQQGLSAVARELGLEFAAETDGRSGLTAAERGQFSVVVLDLGLPSMGGGEICKRLRMAKPRLPIVILTSRNDELSRVLGLELGADDYVIKPFSLPELVARIRAIFRRIETYSSPDEAVASSITIGDVTLDFRTRGLLKKDVPVEVSRTEFDLLAYFFLNPGVVIRREELAEEVWGYNCSGFDGTVTTYISRVRQKIEEDMDSPKYLVTVRGVGYRLVDPNA